MLTTFAALPLSAAPVSCHAEGQSRRCPLSAKEIARLALASWPNKVLLAQIEKLPSGLRFLNWMSHARGVYPDFAQAWAAARRGIHAGHDHSDAVKTHLELSKTLRASDYAPLFWLCRINQKSFRIFDLLQKYAIEPIEPLPMHLRKNPGVPSAARAVANAIFAACGKRLRRLPFQNLATTATEGNAVHLRPAKITMTPSSSTTAANAPVAFAYPNCLLSSASMNGAVDAISSALRALACESAAATGFITMGYAATSIRAVE